MMQIIALHYYFDIWLFFFLIYDQKLIPKMFAFTKSLLLTIPSLQK